MARGHPETLTNAGKGRPKGVPNLLTRQVKDMIAAALDKAGGVDYLAEQAEKNPAAFMTLVGKLLPIQAQLTGAEGGPIQTLSLDNSPVMLAMQRAGLPREDALRALASCVVPGEGVH